MKDHLTEDQLIKYQFELLSEKQMKNAAAHLEKCLFCRERLEHIAQKFAALDLLKEDAVASDRLISKTLARVGQSEPSVKKYFLRPAWVGAAAAVIILAVGLVAILLSRKPSPSERIEIAKTPDEATTKEKLDSYEYFKTEQKRYSAAIPEKPPFAPASKIELVTLPKRESVQLTIYNSADLTLVRERRNLTMKKGWNWLQFMWANTLIDPTSLSLEPLEQKDKINLEQLVFPAGLKEVGRWLIRSEVSGQVPFEITYFTSGLRWRAFYMGTLTEDEKTMRLTGYVRVTNNSGDDYENAQTRLIVGKINLLDRIAELARRMYPYGRPGKLSMIAPRSSGEIRKEFLYMDAVIDEDGNGIFTNGLFHFDQKEIKKEGLSE